MLPGLWCVQCGFLSFSDENYQVFNLRCQLFPDDSIGPRNVGHIVPKFTFIGMYYACNCSCSLTVNMIDEGPGANTGPR